MAVHSQHRLRERESTCERVDKELSRAARYESAKSRWCMCWQVPTPAMPPTKAVLKVLPATTTYPGAQFRLAGDRYTQPLTDPPILCHSLRRRPVQGLM